MRPTSLVETVATIALELVTMVIAVATIEQCVDVFDRTVAELTTIRDICLLEARVTQAGGFDNAAPLVRPSADGHLLALDDVTIRVPALRILAAAVESQPIPHVRMRVAAADGTHVELAIPFSRMESDP